MRRDQHRIVPGAAAIGAAVAIVLSGGCATPESQAPAADVSEEVEARRSLDPPAIEGAFAPQVWSDEVGLLMTWLEPLGSEREDGHRVQFAALAGDTWSDPVTIVEGKDLFANWADVPGVARDAGGVMVAHWLAKTAADTYAYSIYLARSTDGGATWRPIGTLNDDQTHTEHGFVSWVRGPVGLLAYWLDGREMVDGGAMTLRSVSVMGDDAPPRRSGTIVDRRVCECCSTDAARAGGRQLVVYRDRSADEVRDISLVGSTLESLFSPVPVGADGWQIEGCPVNGPSIAADDSTVTTGWFTAAGDRPRVQTAISHDGGVSFGDPVVVDDTRPLGRVDVAMLDGAAAIAWFGSDGERAAVNLRRVGRDGTLGEIVTVGHTAMARASGFPRLARIGDSLLVTWVEIVDDTPSRIRVDEIALATIAG